MTAYDLVTRYKDEHGALPTAGVELTELRHYADRIAVDMPDEDDVMAVVQQLRTWNQPATGQPSFWKV